MYKPRFTMLPNHQGMLSGVDARLLDDLLVQASLHCYDEIDKYESPKFLEKYGQETCERHIKYARECLNLWNAFKDNWHERYGWKSPERPLLERLRDKNCTRQIVKDLVEE